MTREFTKSSHAKSCSKVLQNCSAQDKDWKKTEIFETFRYGSTRCKINKLKDKLCELSGKKVPAQNKSDSITVYSQLVGLCLAEDA